MASNKELTEKILVINPTAITENLTNAQLAQLLKELKETEGDDGHGEGQNIELKIKAVGEVVETETGYFVKKGKALVTLAGTKGEGVNILPKYVNGGEETLKNLVKSGHLEKR